MACKQEMDMLWSLADTRAKGILLEERGFYGFDRITVLDELRISSKILFQSGHAQILADGRDEIARRQRAYVPVAVSQSFPAVTFTLTAACNTDKLSILMIRKLKGPAINIKLPTREDVLKSLGIREGSESAARVPEVP